MTAAKRAVGAMERATIMREERGYLYAEFRSRLLGYVDDVELLYDGKAGVLHVVRRRGWEGATSASTGRGWRSCAPSSQLHDDRLVVRRLGRSVDPHCFQLRRDILGHEYVVAAVGDSPSSFS